MQEESAHIYGIKKHAQDKMLEGEITISLL